MDWIGKMYDAVLKALNRTHVKLVAARGTLIIDDTNAHTGLSGLSLMAQSATVIASCTGVDGNGAAINFVSTYNWVTIAAGIPIIAPDNCKITAITLTSGSIALYS